MTTNLKSKQTVLKTPSIGNPGQSGIYLNVEEMHSLIEENLEVAKKLAWKLLRTWRIRLPEEDVVSIVGYALAEAANRFDPTREASFKTFLFYHLRGLLIKEVTRIIQHQRVYSFIPQEFYDGTEINEAMDGGHQKFPAVDLKTPERLLEQKELAEFCEEASSFLDPLQKEVIVRYFYHDESLTTIAQTLGYCRCHISRVKGKAMAILKAVINLSCRSDSSNKQRNYILVESLSLSAIKQIRSDEQNRYTGGRGRRKKQTKQRYLVASVRKAAA